jgi:hypothetical protein
MGWTVLSYGEMSRSSLGLDWVDRSCIRDLRSGDEKSWRSVPSRRSRQSVRYQQQHTDAAPLLSIEVHPSLSAAALVLDMIAGDCDVRPGPSSSISEFAWTVSSERSTSWSFSWPMFGRSAGDA